MYYWVRASSSDFGGTLPQPRSGHSAVNVGNSKVVVFGGLADKKFLSDLVVYDIENKLWFQPECTGNGSDGQVGPGPRAFHIAVAIDCHMFVFGGRFGSKRLGDFWVLDTDIWQWSELTSFGDLPSPRDFSAASSIGNTKIVMYGGWDGKRWLSDVYVLDTISLEWTELPVSGSVPPPRCGHTATMVEKRLLIYGGRGGGGPIMGDLWALKGLIEQDYTMSEDVELLDSLNRSLVGLRSDLMEMESENETPGWTQLKLPGQAPSPRCGHTVTFGGHYLLLFGGHGTGGWLSRYDVYYNDCIILDRVSAQWKRLPIGNEPPLARAYHSMTCLGSHYLLFGGFDGKSTYGDMWWLVPKEDPIAKRHIASLPNVVPQNKDMAVENDNSQSTVKESQRENSPFEELQKRLEISLSLPSHGLQIMDEFEDKEFLELASRLMGGVFSNGQESHVQVLRDHWKKSSPESIPLRELGPLLRDYQRLITRHLYNDGSYLHSTEPGLPGNEAYTFYHLKNASKLRMVDIANLLEEYKKLLPD